MYDHICIIRSYMIQHAHTPPPGNIPCSVQLRAVGSGSDAPRKSRRLWRGAGPPTEKGDRGDQVFDAQGGMQGGGRKQCCFWLISPEG